MSLTVAVIAGGGFQGQGIIEAIHAIPDARALVVDSTRDALGELLADRYVVAPPLDEPAFEDFLLDLVQAEDVALVVPATQRELQLLARMSSQLWAKGARTAVCPGELLDIVLDKQALYAALEAADLPVQQCVRIDATAPVPLFGRPRFGWGGRETIVLTSLAEVRPEEMEPLSGSHVWVPKLEAFREFSADFAIDFHGNTSPVTLRRRVRTSSGFAVVSESAGELRVMHVLERLAEWLTARDARGIFNIQVLATPDGELFISDVNPRHGTSSGHALAEGNNLVAFTLGIRSSHARQSVRTVRSLAQQSIPLFEPGSIGAVVFDLDDTLIDHKRWIIDRMQLAAGSLEDMVDPAALLLQTYLAVEEGEHARLIDVVIERLDIPSLHGPLLAAYREATPTRAHLFPEVIDVLSSLRRQGVKLALITDNPPASQRAKLAACGTLAEAFESLVFSREHGAEKPARAPYDAIVASLGLSPGKLLMVGDNPTRDAFGSVRAGWRSCLLVDRPGGRFRFHRDLLERVAPEVAARTWTAPDLRVLPLALRLTHRNGGE